jgi:hypothetical protein
MSELDDRGSSKLLQQLFGAGGPKSHAEVAKILGINIERARIVRWWWFGQPAIDRFFGTFEVGPDHIGELAGLLIRNGLVVDGFPLGKPAIDRAILNVSNVPHELR